ncbi:MAG TPA: sialidase family protein [Dermatophilaceae bacterium]|nr:sialidase family protein [Dermatophilaceae bacterium]
MIDQTPRTAHLTGRRPLASRTLLTGVGAGLVAALALSGCSQSGPPEPKSVAAGTLPGEHVHGISRDPGSGKVNLATHEGLFVQQADASWLQVGPTVDFMSFAITGPGTFYASGHPGEGVDLPAPVGLMKSSDAGLTWSVQSLGGQSDFHTLTASSRGVMGFDGALKVTSDGKTWAQGGLTAEPRSLASAPDGSQVLATTAQGVLSSTDGGGTWAPLASAPPLVLTAWADSKTVVGLTTDGGIAVSEDAGASWKTSPAQLTSGQVISASRDKAGALEILVVTDTTVLQSGDNGATFADLKS